MQYLHKVFSLLHLFKKGNIGFVQMFFEQKYTALGFITNNMKQTDNSVLKNVIDDTMYTLSDGELSDCNTFLGAYDDSVYCLIKDNIDEFIWGLEQIDNPKGFEQYTTSLEKIMLAKGQQGKKEACLSSYHKDFFYRLDYFQVTLLPFWIIVDSIIEFKDFLLENGATIMKDIKETPIGINMIVKHFEGTIVEYVEQQN